VKELINQQLRLEAGKNVYALCHSNWAVKGSI